MKQREVEMINEALTQMKSASVKDSWFNKDLSRDEYKHQPTTPTILKVEKNQNEKLYDLLSIENYRAPDNARRIPIQRVPTKEEKIHSKEEVLDLLAFVLNRGNEDSHLKRSAIEELYYNDFFKK